MDSVCYAKKKNGELCNTNLKEKNRHEIKIENGIYFVCGRHKKINNIEDIDISRYKVTDNVNKKDDKDDIINEFNEKLNISNDKKQEEDDNKKIDKTDTKKPCLQYIIYLISKDNSDMCQFEDCQFAHNINIVYTDK
jgi:hypothetical protein